MTSTPHLGLIGIHKSSSSVSHQVHAGVCIAVQECPQKVATFGWVSKGFKYRTVSLKSFWLLLNNKLEQIRLCGSLCYSTQESYRVKLIF